MLLLQHPFFRYPYPKVGVNSRGEPYSSFPR